MKKLIELWKTNCEHCEAIKPIVEQLKKQGYMFGKHNIEDLEGEALWQEYTTEIDDNNRKMKYELGYIYTPTFINPQTRIVLSFIDREPTKEELIQLAKGGE